MVLLQARELDDPAGLFEKTEYLLREWVNIYHSREAYKYRYEEEFRHFVGLLNRHGILKTDDMITKFIKMSTQMCVDLCYAALAEQNNAPTLVRRKSNLKSKSCHQFVKRFVGFRFEPSVFTLSTHLFVC